MTHKYLRWVENVPTCWRVSISSVRSWRLQGYTFGVGGVERIGDLIRQTDQDVNQVVGQETGTAFHIQCSP